MGCRIFDGQLERHEFAMCVGSFLHGHIRRGIGEHWGGVESASLGRLEKILLVCLVWDRR